jgi:tetratricopeptide (TPR) repeat protein
MRITGPKIFRLNVADLKKNSRSGEILFRLYDKITKDTETYYPRTVVTAIREMRKDQEEEPEEAALEGKKKIEEVIKLIKDKNFDDASEILDDLESTRRMKRMMGEIISFYQAEILFQKMEFDKALEIFKEMYDGSIPDNHYREMTLARALLCAELTGQKEIKRELIEEYKKRYGRDGDYRDLISEIR